MNKLLKDVAGGEPSIRRKVHVHLQTSTHVGTATVISRHKPTISNF